MLVYSRVIIGDSLVVRWDWTTFACAFSSAAAKMEFTDHGLRLSHRANGLLCDLRNFEKVFERSKGAVTVIMEAQEKVLSG